MTQPGGRLGSPSDTARASRGTARGRSAMPPLPRLAVRSAVASCCEVVQKRPDQSNFGGILVRYPPGWTQVVVRGGSIAGSNYGHFVRNGLSSGEGGGKCSDCLVRNVILWLPLSDVTTGIHQDDFMPARCWLALVQDDDDSGCAGIVEKVFGQRGVPSIRSRSTNRLRMFASLSSFLEPEPRVTRLSRTTAARPF